MLFLQITSKENDVIRAKILTRNTEGGVYPDDVPEVILSPTRHTFDINDRHIIPFLKNSDMKFPDVRVGDVIVGNDAQATCNEQGEMVVHLVNDINLFTHVDNLDILKPFLAQVTEREVCWEELNWQYQYALECRKPDTALVFAWKNDEGSTDSYVVAKQGAALFFTEGTGDCRDYGLPDVDGPGLYILRDSSPYEHRDWESGVVDDWGLEGDWEATSMENACQEFSLDVDTLNQTLRDVYPYILHPEVDILTLAHFDVTDDENDVRPII